MSQLTKIVFVGGSLDGCRRSVLGAGEQLALPTCSDSGVPATEVYVRRRVNGMPIALAGDIAPYDLAVRRRAPEAVRT